MKTTNFFYIPNGTEIAKRFLEIHNNDWNAAKRSALTMVDKHRGFYFMRRRYCAAYVWLLLNEPTPRLLGAVPTVTSLHIRIFSPSK